MSFVRTVLTIFNFRIRAKSVDAEFVEEKAYEAGFSEFYLNKIRPLAQKIEELRVERLKQIAFRGRLILLSWLILMIACQRPVSSDDTTTSLALEFALTFCFLLFSPFLIRSVRKKFKAEAEKKFLENIGEFFGKNFVGKYAAFSSDAEGLYKRIKIIPKGFGVGYRLRNGVSGSYRNVNFNFEELRCFVEGRFGFSSFYTIRNRTLFQGIAIIFDVNKSFTSHTVLLRNRFVLFPNVFLKELGLENCQKIKIEDPWLKEVCSLYSENESEARELVSPAFSQGLKELSELFGTKKIQASFCDKKLLLAFDRNRKILGFPENAVFKKSDLIAESRAMLEQMNLVFRAIDLLNYASNSYSQ